MIEDGSLDGVDFVIAQHVEPKAVVGTIGISSGPVPGGVDSWFGMILGVGGHGAHPHQTIDPFNILVHVIMALNGIVSRRLNPFQPAVVSIGTIHGGFAQNVIPGELEIAGTLRCTDPAIQQQIRGEIRRAFEITRNLGGDYKLRFDGDHLMKYKNKIVCGLFVKARLDSLMRFIVNQIHDCLQAQHV